MSLTRLVLDPPTHCAGQYTYERVTLCTLHATDPRNIPMHMAEAPIQLTAREYTRVPNCPRLYHTADGSVFQLLYGDRERFGFHAAYRLRFGVGRVNISRDQAIVHGKLRDDVVVGTVLFSLDNFTVWVVTDVSSMPPLVRPLCKDGDQRQSTMNVRLIHRDCPVAKELVFLLVDDLSYVLK